MILNSKVWCIKFWQVPVTWISDRMNYSFEEVLTVKVWLIENPSLGQTAVDWKGVTTWCDTFWREGEEYFDIFLQALLPDRLFQLHMLCSSISDNKDHPIIRHVVQGHLNSWAKEYETALTLQYKSLFLVFVFLFFVILSFCLFVFLSFCLFIFLSFYLDIMLTKCLKGLKSQKSLFVSKF